MAKIKHEQVQGSTNKTSNQAILKMQTVLTWMMSLRVAISA